MLLFWHIYHPEFQWWCLFCGLCHVYQYHLPNTWKIPPEKISNLSRDKENCAVQPCGLCENYGVKKWEQDALILNVPSADPCIKPFTLGLRGLDQFLQHWNQLIKQWFYFKPGWACTDGWLDESSHMMTLYKKMTSCQNSWKKKWWIELLWGICVNSVTLFLHHILMPVEWSLWILC